MKASVSFAALLVLPACSGMPPVDAEEREYRRVDARLEAIENFERMSRACRHLGGTVVLPREAGGRLPPTVTDFRKASCTSPAVF